MQGAGGGWFQGRKEVSYHGVSQEVLAKLPESSEAGWSCRVVLS